MTGRSRLKYRSERGFPLFLHANADVWELSSTALKKIFGWSPILGKVCTPELGIPILYWVGLVDSPTHASFRGLPFSKESIRFTVALVLALVVFSAAEEPYPVHVNRDVPVPVPHPVAVPVSRPYPVHVPHPVAVPVERPYPVPVERPVAYPVHQAVPYPVAQPVAVPVSRPYPVVVSKPVAVPVAQPVVINKPVAVSVGGGYGLGSG
ncbi:unnamed protein product, partial [Timema podura]|nr:unnamed protein product [Timema podura]